MSSTLRKSLVLSAADRYGSTVIQFATSLVIARLLTPTEVGIFSVGAVVVSISHTLRDFGISNYLIQEQDLTRDRLRTAQGLTLAIGWLIATVLFTVSTPLAIFYGEPAVETVLKLLSLNFLILPFGSITAALLKRNMRFNILLRANLASTVAQAVTSIWLAYESFGPMSLAWGGVASVVVATAVTLLHREKDQPWIPSIREWKRVIAKSGRFSAASLLYEFGLGAPELLTGKFLGFHSVGILSRATGAVTLVQRIVIDAIQPVVLPYFAQRLRSKEEIDKAFLHALTLMTGITWSALATLAIGAETIIEFLYGPAWMEAALPLQILCLGMAAMTIASTSSSILVASGKAPAILTIQLIGQSVKIGCLFFLARNGLTFVAISMILGDLIIALGYGHHAVRVLQLDIAALLRALMKSIMPACMCVLLCTLASIPLSGLAVSGRMAGLLGVAIIGWISGLVMARHPLLDEAVHLLSMVKQRFK